MVATRIMGGSHHCLLTASDPVEVMVERLVIDRAFDQWMKLQEARNHELANEVAKRFGGH